MQKAQVTWKTLIDKPCLSLKYIFFRAGLEDESYSKMKELIYTLPPPRIVIMRYLFAFLNHLSQYSDENLMYPYNLAVCFGPALLPIPDNKDQVCISHW